jgi:NAD(P)-dependent dehydrogenase (short-subunit alcohol dehydrogenase family)
MRDFQGKTAVVTGAASGIGLGMAKALAGAGMNVALCDLRPDPLERARQTIELLGVKAIGIPTDVSDLASVAAAAVAIERAFGKVHVSVNNAGVAMHGTPVE